MAEKKYVSDNAQLIAEWDWEKNKTLNPTNLTVGSNMKVWWIGSCGHHWEAQIKSRNHGRGCPICAGKIVCPGVNDLKTTRPDIAAEWNYQKNDPLTPSEISQGSHTKVWWKCQHGHSWLASPNHRTSKDRGCPYCCHNPRALTGENDLKTIYPNLVKEWHPTKNNPLLPEHFTANSSQKVWWKCAKGHEWKTAINHRANGSGCPYCRSSAQTSFPEQAIYYYVKKAYPDTINGYTDMFNNHGMELDVYVPSLNIGIEYDGIAFHKTTAQKRREEKKYVICKEHGTFLIRIRENPIDDTINICDKTIAVTNSLTASITELKVNLPKLFDIDVMRDEQLIRANFYSELKDKTLLNLYPELSKEWNYNRNEGLSPDMFTAHSSATVWWSCSKGHEWSAKIVDRARGNGCPYCANRKVLCGYNDLASKRPDLVKEWNYLKNSFSPSSILPGSGKKAWWICSICKYEWYAEISSRNKGASCPACARKKLTSRSR